MFVFRNLWRTGCNSLSKDRYYILLSKKITETKLALLEYMHPCTRGERAGEAASRSQRPGNQPTRRQGDRTCKPHASSSHLISRL